VKTALLLAFALAGPAGAKVVIRAGGVEFTTDHVRQRLYEVQGKGFTPEQILDGLVTEAALAAEARKTRLLETDADCKASVAYVRMRLLSDLYTAKVAKIPKPTEAEARAAFHLREDTAHMQTVAVATREEAAALRTRIERGSDIGVEAARSLDPAGAAKRGDTGVLPRIVLDEALASAVFAAPKGGLIGPIQSGNGWLVAKVVATTVGTEAQFAASRERIDAFLVAQSASQARAHAIEMLRKQARISIEPALASLDRNSSAAALDQVVLTVNDRRFRYREILPALRGIQQGGHGGGAATRNAVDDFASDHLLASEVQSRGLDREPASIAALERAETHALAEFLGRRVLAGLPAKESERRRGELFQKRIEALKRSNDVWIDRPAALAALRP